MSYTIYIHRNKTNEKVYVGQTRQKNLNQRWRSGKGYENNTLFYKAIQKYGWENFDHEIIATCSTKDEADKMEIEMIAFYDSMNPEKGYNLTIGGGGTNGYRLTEEQRNRISEVQTGRKLTEEWKQHISESLKGENAPFYGKSFSEEHRKHLSESHKGQVSAMGMLGKKHTEETKRKMSETRVGHETSDETRLKIGKALSKSVRCIETGVIYYGIAEASRQTGFNKSGIWMCCNGRQETCHGYHWEFVN